jgi:hypothetical protein
MNLGGESISLADMLEQISSPLSNPSMSENELTLGRVETMLFTSTLILSFIFAHLRCRIPSDPCENSNVLIPFPRNPVTFIQYEDLFDYEELEKFTMEQEVWVYFVIQVNLMAYIVGVFSQRKKT